MISRRLKWLPVIGLGLPMMLFLLLRLPTLIHQPGMQDEQWFAVPGLTVWQEGIPRIPYLPTRNRDTLFENADVCLMALPPGLFYVQAPFYAIFPPGYATARIPLFLAALTTIAIVFWVVKRLHGSDFAAAAAATLVALSRPLMFTGLTTRPDLLCMVAGWLAIVAAWEMMRRQGSNRLAVVSGSLSGLAGLFHPFALVFAIQGGLAMLLCGGSLIEKLKRAVLFVAGNAAVIGFWIPLIVAYPDEFRSQFFANVLDRAGPGLPARLIWPFPSLLHHAELLWQFAGPLQCGLMAGGLLLGSALFWRCRSLQRAEKMGMIALAWSSVYLTATVAGMHPTKGYWVYPFIWVVALTIVGIEDRIKRLHWGFRQYGVDRVRIAVAITTFALALLAMLPGAGLRTTWIYLAHWKQPDVYAPAFIHQVLKALPNEGVFYADLSYVFDVYLSGRETRLCQEREHYWGAGKIDYSYLVLSWEGADANWAEQYDGKFVRRVGDRSIPQHCFVDLYRPADERLLDQTPGSAGLE
ncbi:glycosyltransferase family 39 protein [Stieleria sp. TO1_6]|uniref:ArnT family glycosyltransferase n=1 Tax=Stieleria tagensis TaxID=2956795 RepID=UPI00209A9A8A|nr:glycosyltransferase family 39 protein [Stieleria tagensis]MCO8123268.1 glycosyltransferase family 39 protein [Stieleria tagensis]